MSSSDPPVSIVIVSYNTRDHLHRCLSALGERVDPSLASVIVLDNASDDGSGDMVESEFPAVTLIRSSTNLGFAAGVNEAARHARGEHLLLLNPDTEIHPGAVEALLAAARRRPSIGLVGGRTLTPDGDLDRRSCWGLPTPWSSFCFGTGLSTLCRNSKIFDPESLGPWKRDSEREVGALSGALLLIDVELWRRLDGFDEDYFMYSEDIDLAFRAKALGRASIVTPDAEVTHVVGASSKNRSDKMILVMTGKATYLRKNWTGWRRAWGLAMLWLGTAVRAAVQRTRSNVPGDRMWPEVWRARRWWFSGYGPGGSLPVVETGPSPPTT